MVDAIHRALFQYSHHVFDPTLRTRAIDQIHGDGVSAGNQQGQQNQKRGIEPDRIRGISIDSALNFQGILESDR